MARTARKGATATRSRRRAGTGGTSAVVGQISQIVAANQELLRQRQDLHAENDRLRRELTEIGVALGHLTGSARRGPGRRGAQIPGLAEIKPKRQPQADYRPRAAGTAQTGAGQGSRCPGGEVGCGESRGLRNLGLTIARPTVDFRSCLTDTSAA